MSGGRGSARRFPALLAVLSFVAVWFSLVPANVGVAHEVRPAYLELKEATPGVFDMLFKTPMLGDLRLSLDVRFSGRVEPATPVMSRRADNALVQTWQIRAIEPLAGQEIRIDGIENTVTDALVRVEFADGRAWVQRLTPAQPRATVPARQNGWEVAATYLQLGIGHILLGIDHLLFVLGLILITANTRQLVKAITAFTAAHSITLAAATLGFVHVPPAPVEAVIALSILFLASELARHHRGERGLTARFHWLVAFSFGLLHGFGFAGALAEVGLPANDIPLALLMFNIGVEAGQLLFVAAVLTVLAVGRRLIAAPPRWLRDAPAYAIGSPAAFWLIERIAAFG